MLPQISFSSATSADPADLYFWHERVLVVKPMKVAACQLPDVRQNQETALSWIETFAQRATIDGASLVCFPECFLQGYLVEEKAARSEAIDLSSAAFDAVLQRLSHLRPTLVFGMIETAAGALFNTAVVVDSGRLVGRYRKSHLLSGEGIFRPGTSCPIFEVDGFVFGVNICSDTQLTENAAMIARQGGKLIICPANNMMRRENAEKWKDRHNEIRAQRAKETGLWLISSDVTGERDDSIALGPTAVINPRGKVVAHVPLMQVGIVVAEIPREEG